MKKLVLYNVIVLFLEYLAGCFIAQTPNISQWFLFETVDGRLTFCSIVIINIVMVFLFDKLND